jgi:hypothetical protein
MRSLPKRGWSAAAQKQAVDGVFIGAQAGIGEGGGHQAAHPMVEDEQVEEE